MVMDVKELYNVNTFMILLLLVSFKITIVKAVKTSGMTKVVWCTNLLMGVSFFYVYVATTGFI